MKKIYSFVLLLCVTLFCSGAYAAVEDVDLNDYQTKAIMAIYKAVDSNDPAVQMELQKLVTEYSEVVKTVKMYQPELIDNNLEKDVMQLNLASLLSSTTKIFSLLGNLASIGNLLGNLGGNMLGGIGNLGGNILGGLGGNVLGGLSGLANLGQMGTQLMGNLSSILNIVNTLSTLIGILGL
jgi:hypothetical protein